MEQDILKIAKRTLALEQSALQILEESLGADFVKVCELVEACTGRLVVTGIGKSAIIAQKIVATLNSTGTPSLYMHAADAIHGDLGMVQPQDLVLCISKSGESPEIKVLVPFVHNLGNQIIGMCSNKKSFLGTQSDYLLWTPVSKEADPNNLAPTTSTTVQMAMGDALATVLLERRGFSHQDFARFHPGGALGKQLYLRVKELYHNNEKPSVELDTDLRAIIIEMTSKRLGVTVVLDEDKIEGIITDGDLRRMLTNQDEVAHLKAADIMSKNPKTIQANALAVNALEMMRSRSITQLIVEEEGEYVGIVHLHDLIREGLI